MLTSTGHKSKQIIRQLILSPPHQLYLRDGEVVIYKRPSSAIWQCRFKQQNNTWVRISTKKSSLENAIQTACLIYDEARFRQKLGLTLQTRSFAQIAHATIEELKKQLDGGTGKVAPYLP
jgi:integrase